jgi:hypothetical protein
MGESDHSIPMDVCTCNRTGLGDMPDAPPEVRARWRNEARGTIIAFSAMFLLAIAAVIKFHPS